MGSPSSLDRAETVVAAKRIARWPSDWQSFVIALPANERELVVALTALLDARPGDEAGTAE
jgi:hypothetical protein